MWRKRVGVEPTPESAKDTGYGFEDHEDHRAPFASVLPNASNAKALLRHEYSIENASALAHSYVWINHYVWMSHHVWMSLLCLDEPTRGRDSKISVGL